MKLVPLALALVVTGCSIGSPTSDGFPPGGDAPSPPTSPPPPVVDPSCGLELRFDPPLPVADPSSTIRVSVLGDGHGGVVNWDVTLNGGEVPFSYVQPDHTSIELVAASPGIYVIALEVNDSNLACTHASRTLNVRAAGAKLSHLRLRVAPPTELGVPPLEQPLTIEGGANADLGAIVIDRGVPVDLHVMGAGGGVPAYVRFSPTGSRNAVVEAFADSAGRVDATLADDLYSVLVVPSGAGGVPHRFSDWASAASNDLSVVGGAAISGSVHDPADTAIAGATVQLSIDGVPSTVATTDAAGRFTVQAAATTGAVTVEVDPPAASGLPRLAASSTSFDLAQPVQVRYAANLIRRSLSGVQVKRAGVAVAGARLMVVGSLPAIGTVMVGASATATGEVRIAAIANGAGALPAQLIPAAQLQAVVTVAPGDLAVAALDTTSAVPAALDAPAMQVIATGAAGPGGVMLPGAVLDIVPSGALAMAAAPPLHLIADSNGTFTAALAAGGHYDLRFLDPGGRAGPLVVGDRVATTVERDGYPLPKVLGITGALLLGGTQALPNASVQILCSTCTGVERTKPIAEGMSDETGRFILAVPDPGTM
jgi:hypothetical protein